MTASLADPPAPAVASRSRPVGWPRALGLDLAALATIALAVAWLHWRALFEPGTWFPAGGGDLASLIYPNYRFAADSLRAGEIPFWNPFIQSGTPFAADIQSGLLYPINLLAYLLVPTVTYRVVMALALFHLWLAGALAYAAARGLGAARAGATLAGVAYALSDFFVVHVGNLNLIAVAAWLPLVLLAAERVATRPTPRWVGLGGLAVAMAALAGHVQPLLYGLVAIGLVGLFHLWRAVARADAPAAGARVALGLGAMVVLGMAAAAVQLLPAAELTGLSVRAAIPYDTSTEYSLPPEQLISLLVPGFFGRGPDGYWGQWRRTEAGYVGVLTLVLAGLALALRPRHGPRLRALALVAGGGLVLALGGYTAVHGLVYRFVPLFGSLRAPARAIVLLDLALALLAGLGLTLLLRADRLGDRRRLAGATAWLTRGLGYVLALVPLGLVLLLLLRENPALPRATSAVEGWTMLALWLGGAVGLVASRRSGWLRPATIGALAVGWVMADLVTNGQGLELTRRDPAAGFERPAVVAFLRQDTEPYRIDTDTGVWDIWQPNLAMVQRIPDVVGGIHPLELSDFRRYWSALGSRSTPLYDLLNARYAIARKDVPLDRAKFEVAFDGDPEINVYRNRRALPRAFLVGGAIVEPDHDRALERIHASGFDPAATVVVEAGRPLDGAGAAGPARLTDYRTSRLTVAVEPSAPAYLVLAEVWYPGWRAWVDGRPVAIERADFLFRAVAVEPGDRLVELRFEPTSWRPALALTAAAWLTIGLLLAVPRWRRRSRPHRGRPT